MASRKPVVAAPPTPLLYTAQDFAHFCEVDLKTIHHWADRGKVAHFRTEGRHLRFRRNEIVRFLRAHGYPLPAALTEVKPQVSLALRASSAADDVARRLGVRFVVRRYPTSIAALTHLLACEPDVLILEASDPCLLPRAAIAALKADPDTAYVAVVVVGDGLALEDAKSCGADLTLAAADLGKLTRELTRALAMT